MFKVLEPGTTLAGRFDLVRLIGRGAVGNVWQATDRQLDEEPVACKVLNPHLTEDRQAVADLKREVLLTRRLRHPAILAVYTFWEDEGARFITMEYVPGKNLEEILIERGRAFKVHEVLPWLVQIAGALDYAHGQGVLHRDVKPANVLLAPDDTVRLADFGIARAAREVRTRATGQLTSGTILYISPEQLLGRATDPRSDLYSLGAATYALLAGVPPFSGESVVAQVQLKTPGPVPGLSGRVNEALAAALAKDPSKRPGSCSEWVRRLSEAARSGGSEAEPPASVRMKLQDPDAETVALDKVRPGTGTERLGALLAKAGLITQEQLDAALETQKRTGQMLGMVLLEEGLVSGQDVVRALEAQLGLPAVYSLQGLVLTEAARLLSRSFAQAHCCIPLRVEGGTLTVAMANPLDLTAINAIENRTGLTVEPCIATASAVRRAIARSLA